MRNKWYYFIKLIAITKLSVDRIFIKPVKVDTVCGFSVGHLLHKINYDVKRATILLTNNK